MQVTNQYLKSNLTSTDLPLELRQGEIYTAQIKEKISDTEAVVQIRGKELTAHFESEIPSDERVNVQITGQKEQAVIMRTVSVNNSEIPELKTNETATILESLGVSEKETPELKRAAQVLLDKGLPLTKEAISELKSFFAKTEGESTSKIDTVKALANKKLEVTQTHLRAIHEALHGRPINEILTDIAKEIDPEFKVKNSETTKIQSIIKNEMVKELSESPVQEASTINQNPKQLTSPATNQLKELVRSVREGVEKEPDLQKVIQRVRTELVKNPNLEKELTSKIEIAASEAEKLQSIGKERLVQALKNAEDQLSKSEINSVKKNEGPSSARSNYMLDPKDLIASIKEEVHKNPNLNQSVEKVRQEIVANNRFPRELADKISKPLDEVAALIKQGRITTGKEVLSNAIEDLEDLAEMKTSRSTQVQSINSTQGKQASEIVSQVKFEIQKQQHLGQALEKVREQIVANPKIDREVAQKVEQAAKEAIQLQRIGKEGAGQDRLLQALSQAETELKQVETRQQPVNQGQPPNEVVTDIKEEVQREPNLQKAVEKVREQIVANPRIDREVAQKIEQATKEAMQLQRMGKEGAGRERVLQALSQAETELKQNETRQQPVSKAPSEIVIDAKEEVQKEPNLQKAVEKVREQIIANPKIDREVAQKVEQATKEAMQLQRIGKEGAGRERLLQALSQAETELKQNETRQQPASKAPSEIVIDAKEEVQKEPNLQKAVEKVRELIVTNPKIDREVAQKVEQAAKEALQLQKLGKEGAGRDRLLQALTQAETELKQNETRQQPASKAPSEIVIDAKEEVQKEPNLQKAVEKVREQIVANPKIDREVAQKIEQAAKEALQLQQLGKEGAGRDRLLQALTQAETELKQVETRQQPVNQGQPPNEVVTEIKEEVQKEPNLQKAVEKVREHIVTNPKIDHEVAQKVEQAAKEAIQLQRIGKEGAGRDQLLQALSQAETELKQVETRQQPVNQGQPPNEVVNDIKDEVQREPNLQKAVEKVREHIVTNPKIDHEVAQKVEQAAKEALHLQQLGREGAGRDRLVQALSQVEKELTQIELNNQETNQPSNNDTDLKEVIKQVRQQVQTESDVTKVLQKIQTELLKDPKLDPKVAQEIERFTKQANQLTEAGRDRLNKILEQVEEALEVSGSSHSKSTDTSDQQKPVLNQQNVETDHTQPKKNSINPLESIKQAMKQIQSDPNLEDALNTIRKQLSSNPNIDLNVLSKLEKVINQSSELKDKGREIAARQHMNQELKQLEKEVASSEPSQNKNQINPNESLNFDLNELLQPLQLQSKDILVTKITQKLAQMTHDFRELKREISRNLDNVSHIIDTYKKNAYPQAKQMLESTISKLDNTILKSDMMLFTDMKTEKQLLQASSQLADAKKFLSKGEFSQASKIVREVKDLIDKVMFKPSDQKVMHYVSKESMALENKTPSQQLLSQLGEATRGYTATEASARHMFDMVRSLGLNHDSDLANSLVFQRGDQSHQDSTQDQHQQNLKAALMKLQADGDESGTKIAQQAEQVMNNITGQQLLSKSDPNGTMQSMFFNLPMMLGGKPENIQVFVNSKNEGKQVDWENCSLYFLLETKKLGDVGIMLTSTDRNLSITVKNDKPGFKERMAPLAAVAKDKLQEIGFNVNSVHFTRMTATTANTNQKELNTVTPNSKPLRPVFTEKGMDYKI